MKPDQTTKNQNNESGNRSVQFYEEKYRLGDEIPRTSKLYTLSYIPKEGHLKVLDIGCGGGLNSRSISSLGHLVVGIDISNEALKKYRECGFECCRMDVERGLGFDDKYFDLVFCSEVIEHLVNFEVLLEEIHRVLKPGGRLILSTPNSAFWLYRLAALFGITLSEIQHPKHLVFFSKRSLRKLFVKKGLEPIQESGRNIYLILPDPVFPLLRKFLSFLGFHEEIRFRTMSRFYHLSNHSRFLNGLFADTLIMVGKKAES